MRVLTTTALLVGCTVSRVSTLETVLERCKAGCSLIPSPCTADSNSSWLFTSSITDGLLLSQAPGAFTNDSYGLCLNVDDYGTQPGDRIWVTVCHPEKQPMKANEGWSFNDTGPLTTLVNLRSSLCAAFEQNQLSLAKCDAAAANGWSFAHTGQDPRVGQVYVPTAAAAAAAAAATSTVSRQQQQQQCLEIGANVGPPPLPPPGPPAPPPGQAKVTVDFTKVVNVVDEKFLSFTLDGSYNRGWFQRNLSNPLLKFLTRQLHPMVLRFGGSGNDFFEYDVPTGAAAPQARSCLPGNSYPAIPGTAHCPPWSDAKNCGDLVKQKGFCAGAAKGPQPNCCSECNFNWNNSDQGCSKMSTEVHPAMLTCTCLTQPKLDDLLDFSVETNSSLVFGLTYAEDINSTRTKLLLDYLHTRAGGFQMYGYEYGNEQQDGARQAKELSVLQTILLEQQQQQQQRSQMGGDRVVKGATAHQARTSPPPSPPPLSPPLLIGPDWFNTDSTFFAAVKKENVSLHAFTFHEYLQGAVQGKAAALESAVASISPAAIQAVGAAEGVEVWVGEAGGHSGGGILGFTNAYAGGRWYLASLGLHALRGVSVFCRQDLLGGNYGVIADNFPWNVPLNASAEAMRDATPLPDYWSSLLWKRVMGRKVFKANVANNDDLMAFVHCSQQTVGGVAAAFINTDAAPATVHLGWGSPELCGSRVVYALANATAEGYGITLNGEVLEIGGGWEHEDWTLPKLDGKRRSGCGSGDGGGSMVIPGSSYWFVEWPDANVSGCN